MYKRGDRTCVKEKAYTGTIYLVTAARASSSVLEMGLYKCFQPLCSRKRVSDVVVGNGRVGLEMEKSIRKQEKNHDNAENLTGRLRRY